MSGAEASSEITHESGYAKGVAVAIVTQNKDDDGLCRVKVRYPWHDKPRGDRPPGGRPPSASGPRPWSGKPRDSNAKSFAPNRPRPGGTRDEDRPRKRRDDED